MFKILNYLFGWEYVYYNCFKDSGYARIHQIGSKQMIKVTINSLEIELIEDSFNTERILNLEYSIWNLKPEEIKLTIIKVT